MQEDAKVVSLSECDNCSLSIGKSADFHDAGLSKTADALTTRHSSTSQTAKAPAPRKSFSDADVVAAIDALPKLLGEKKLCQHCLGRLFGKVGTGMSNLQRAAEIKRCIWLETVPVLDCWLCAGLFDEVDKFADIIIEEIGGYEYKTYLVGSLIDEELQAREEQIWGETGTVAFAEAIKSEINREVGKALWEKTGKNADFNNPDIVGVIDTRFDSVTLDVRSLFVYGRYKKYSRGIPQTRWICVRCQGKGCEHCNGKGKMYDKSVQEYIGDVALKTAKGVDHAMHGCGREDIDARMLGSGRPFVIEVTKPLVRSIDLEELQKQVNESAKGIVEIDGLRFSDKNEVIRIKGAKPEKTYIAEVAFDKGVEEAKLKLALTGLQGCIINQQTPTRVAHRRADLDRKRNVIRAELKSFESAKAVIEIEAESGTYIKELVSGDNGRTKPNLSELLGVQSRVTALDVICIDEP